jgi:hypothetical protein
MSLHVLNPAPLDALAEDLGDPVAIASMLATFCTSVQSLRAAADQAWIAHDGDALRGTLRDLSATAAMFGAERLASTSRDLADRVGAHDHPVSLTALEVLDEQCVAACSGVRRYVEGTAYDDRGPTRAAGADRG